MDRRKSGNSATHPEELLEQGDLDDLVGQHHVQPDELNLMKSHSDLLRELRSGDDVQPSPGFYARVMNRVEGDLPTTIWDLFLSPQLVQRLTYASLILAAMLFGFLAANHTDRIILARSPETAITQQEHPDNLGADRQRDRQNMLITLAGYSE